MRQRRSHFFASDTLAGQLGGEVLGAMTKVTPRAVFRESRTDALLTWLLFWVGICCGASPYRASSAPVPNWAVFTPENSDLPDVRVEALALSPDGTLWVGTESGLA